MQLRTTLLGVVACLCFAHHAHAQIAYGIAPCGVPVFIYATGMGGMSTIYNGRPVILIDPQVATGDPLFRTFTIFHECGHHVHGDTLPSGLLLGAQGLRPEQELSADCYAAQHVPASVSRHVAAIFRATQGDQSPAPGYPTGNRRSSNILRCAGLSDEDSSSDDQSDSDTPHCPGLPSGMSLTCRFTRGPRAGQVEDFCGTNARPAPTGGLCTDGQGSWGEAQ